MRQYRKRPVVILAQQWHDGEPPIGPMVWKKFKGWIIPTLEGDMLISSGDWIIEGVQGEFYPCKPNIFAATYEPVSEEGILSEKRKLRLVTECHCADPQHIMEFVLLDFGEGNAELWVEVQLNPHLNIWQRFWQGLRYVIGRRSRFGLGHWDCGGLDCESAQQLITLCQEFLRRRAAGDDAPRP